LSPRTLLDASARLVGAALDGGLRRRTDLRPVPSQRVTTFTAQDPEFESRVRTSFEKQRFMATIGARLARVAPGEVDIELSTRDDLVQQHGFLHAGVLASAADSACGYAALSLMPPGAAVLSIEFKINMLAPAAGDRIVARGRVIRAGRTVTVCWGEVTSYSKDGEKSVATMVATMMTVRDRGLAD
jgi:uncharacterized protein (TIGR00369 family)